MVDEFRKNDIFSDHGLPACIRSPTVRRAIFRQSQGQKFFMLGSIFKHGFRATYLQRKSSGYTSMLACGETKDLSHGHSGKDLPQYLGAYQSDEGLAHLRRLCSDPDQESQSALGKRVIWHRVKTSCLRSGCDHYLSLPVSFPLGRIPQAQGSGEAAYASRFTWQHSDDRIHHQRKSSRSQHLRQATDRGGSHIHYGSWLYRLRSFLQDSSISSLFCDAGQEQLQVSTALFTKGRQSNRTQMRSDHSAAWLLCQK